MNRRGWTTKPCPVCGGRTGRPTGRVCSECQSVYDDGKRLQNAFKQTENKILVTHSKIYHWISRPYIFNSSGSSVTSAVTSRLTRAWSGLTNAIAKEPGLREEGPFDGPRTPNLVADKNGLWGIASQYYTNNDTYFLVDREQYAALNDYDTAVRIALEFCFTRGKLDGLNLLKNLNAGTVAPSDFNDVEQELTKIIERIKGYLKEE